MTRAADPKPIPSPKQVRVRRGKFLRLAFRCGYRCLAGGGGFGRGAGRGVGWLAGLGIAGAGCQCRQHQVGIAGNGLALLQRRQRFRQPIRGPRKVYENITICVRGPKTDDIHFFTIEIETH